MSGLLNIIYGVCLIAMTPWLLWRKLFQNKSRRGWSHKLLGRVPRRQGNAACIWIHAVSVGEVNLLKPLIEQLNRVDPNIEVVISTSTETGFDLAQNKYPAQTVFFCPMDFSWAIRQTLKRIRPDLLVLTELELWPNLIMNARSYGAQVMVANARLSESSFQGYRRFQFLLGPVLKSINLIATQNEEYAERFRQLGCTDKQIVTTGNIKFDNAKLDRNHSRTNQLASLLPAGRRFVTVGGSTQFEEDVLLIQTFQKLVAEIPEFQLILVPRHPDRAERISRFINQQGLSFALRSETNGPLEKTDGINPILIIDVIGELGDWWGVADAAYVGGSMGTRGGQNMIEPSAFGIPVSFGPRTANFRNVVKQLLDREAAVVVCDQNEIESFVRRAYVDAAWSTSIGDRARQLVLSQQGATERTLDCLLAMVKPALADRRRAA